MKLYSKNENYKLYQGNMLDMLEVIKPNTIDSIVTDPPYELNFMGKGWDNSGIAFQPDTWKKCYEVLKPGGYLLAFGGSRTFHRIAVAIEDAGFEIRDTIMWIYGSGFPKSMDISKQIDKQCGNSFKGFNKILKDARIKKKYTLKELDKKLGTTNMISWYESGKQTPTIDKYNKLIEILDLPLKKIEKIQQKIIAVEKRYNEPSGIVSAGRSERKLIERKITEPITDLAKQWQGWGTALKPSFEPIIVARKPFEGSLADNVIEYGVGGINIDECRVITDSKNFAYGNEIDRFPANIILTYDNTDKEEVIRTGQEGGFPYTSTDSGSTSRYFYCAKASKKDRDEGLDEFEEKDAGIGALRDSGRKNSLPKRNIHPTVKPTSLMQYLIRLVTPNGGTILDPFNGSGSTGKAVMYENKERNKNYKYIGIELTEEYLPIAKARIEYVFNLPKENAQMNIFDYDEVDDE